MPCEMTQTGWEVPGQNGETVMPQIAWTKAALEAHQAEEARARIRRDQERRRSNAAVRYSERAKMRDNRAKAKAAWRREVFS